MLADKPFSPVGFIVGFFLVSFLFSAAFAPIRAFFFLDLMKQIFDVFSLLFWLRNRRSPLSSQSQDP